MRDAVAKEGRRSIDRRLRGRALDDEQLLRCGFGIGLGLADRTVLVKCRYEAAFRHGRLRGNRAILPGRRAAIVRGRGLSRGADSRDARELQHERHQDDMAKALHHLQPSTKCTFPNAGNQYPVCNANNRRYASWADATSGCPPGWIAFFDPSEVISSQAPSRI